jgi:Protein CHAPERONE-LIKE PROTEIN OF POR1-like
VKVKWLAILMSDHSPYEKLGVTESASFEEIQGVRDRLRQEHSGDPKRSAEVEAAYDAVLMQRLKLRQEGKIKVPDGIRFGEKTPSSLPKVSMPNLPNGLSPGTIFANVFGKPEVTDIAIPTLVAVGLATVAALSPTPDTFQLIAMVATGAALYGTYRKERRLGRAALVGFGGLILGYLLGIVLWAILPKEFKMMIPGGLDVMLTWSVCLVLWLLTLFVK